jgi:hypothetical protein
MNKNNAISLKQMAARIDVASLFRGVDIVER